MLRARQRVLFLLIKVSVICPKCLEHPFTLRSETQTHSQHKRAGYGKKDCQQLPLCFRFLNKVAVHITLSSLPSVCDCTIFAPSTQFVQKSAVLFSVLYRITDKLPPFQTKIFRFYGKQQAVQALKRHGLPRLHLSAISHPLPTFSKAHSVHISVSQILIP